VPAATRRVVALCARIDACGWGGDDAAAAGGKKPRRSRAVSELRDLIAHLDDALRRVLSHTGPHTTASAW
jgi:hypothetical protein